MRIIAGQHRSRNLQTLSGDNTRPTLDRVKEAIFSRIGPYFDGGVMLDLFSGSGSISLEAVSRGFEKSYMNDSNRKAIQIIKTNISSLKAEQQCEVYQLDYSKMIDICYEKGLKFDLIYLDPPYALKLLSTICSKIEGLIKETGIIVCESAPDEEIDLPEKMYIEKQANYGMIKVTYIRRRK